MVSDPVADFINRLKNGSAIGKECVSAPYSKFKFAIATKLKQEGYIKDVAKKGKKNRKSIEVELSYSDKGVSKIQGAERVSKPGRRLYEGVANIHQIKRGQGALIISTPEGIKTDREARKEKIGGETLFKIW